MMNFNQLAVYYKQLAISFGLFFLLLPASVFSRDKDFMGWYGISASYSLSDKVSLLLVPSVRTYHNNSTVNQYFVELGVDYKLLEHLSLTGFYRYGNYLETVNDKFYPRHKWFVDIKGSFPVSDFSFITRVRYDQMFRTFMPEESKYKKVENVVRIRETCKYKTPNFPIDPSIGVEVFLNLFHNSSKNTFGKFRYIVALDYSISKHHAISSEFYSQKIHRTGKIETIMNLKYKLAF